MSAPVIDARNLTKCYGDVTAVDDVSLNVAAGEVYALLGLNGAGKTTVIRMLLGMVRPTAGGVSVLGHAVRPGEHSMWSRVGYLVETPAAYPELTVVEIRDLLLELNEQRGVIVVLSSHILTEVARLATRVGVIDRGRLVREIAADQLAAHVQQRLSVSVRDVARAEKALLAAGLHVTRIGGDHLVLTDARFLREPESVATVLVAAGCPPYRLVVEQDDLETFFLRVVQS